MNLRDRIRELANNKGMSLPVLEATLGFGNGTIVRWDKSSPTAEKLQKVADYFNVSVDYLLGRESSEQTAVLDHAYFSFAKDAQDNGIDPDDIRAVLDIMKRSKEKRNAGNP